MKNQPFTFKKRESDLPDRPFPFEVLHIGEPANNMDIFHWHEFLEISYIQSGSGVYEIEDKVFPVKKGDIIIINGIEKHRVTYGPEDVLYETVIHFDKRLVWSRESNPFDSGYLKLFSNGTNFSNRLEADAESSELVTAVISGIVNEYVQKKPYYEMMIKSQLLTMITCLLRMGGVRTLDDSEVNIKRNNIERLNKILDYVGENFKNDLSMERVAQKFYMNASYFSEYFKKNVGINFSDYLSRLRINEAIRLLNENRLNTAEITYACGFNNASSFYNAFKKVTGKNPGSYVKS